MQRNRVRACGLLAAFVLVFPSASFVPASEVIAFPAPDTAGGKPLMQALAARRSQRAFAAEPLPDAVLGNLLWAACGVNRAERGLRTSPTAVNWQEIEIYVARADGVFLYDAPAHALKRVLAEDIRALVGRQDFVATAPLGLIYVADFARMRRASERDQEFYSATDTGFVSQNVYLFAASEGLATVVLGIVDRDALAAKLGLRAEQRIILCQPVGYPAR